MPVGCPLGIDRRAYERALYDEDLTRSEIADRFGVSVLQVTKWAHKHGCELAPMRRATWEEREIPLRDEPCVTPEVAQRRAEALHRLLVGLDARERGLARPGARERPTRPGCLLPTRPLSRVAAEVLRADPPRLRRAR